MLPRGYRDLRLRRHARERRSQITRVRIPKGIWPTDVFSSAHCLIRLPFEGLALAGDPEVTAESVRTPRTDGPFGNGSPCKAG